jgi:hypothetical protein
MLAADQLGRRSSAALQTVQREGLMPKTMSRAIATTAGACLLVLAMAIGGGQALAAKGPNAGASLKSLVRQANALPPAAAPARKRRALKRSATHARRVAGKRPCASVKDLASFRRVLRGVKVKSKPKSKRARKAAARLAALGPASLRSSRLLLASKRTKRCGGGVKPSRLGASKAKLLSSDENGLKLRVQLAQLNFVPETGGGKSYSKLVAPNSDSPGAPGTPGIPVSSYLLGVPDGAQLDVETSNVQQQTIDGVNVFPAQPDPADAATKAPNFSAPPFTEKPFQISPKAYSAKGFTPGPDTDMLGQARDLNIGALQIPAAQYNPSSKKLKILTSVDVTIAFKGGSKTFSDKILSPWETAQARLAKGLINVGAIEKLRPPIVFPPCGEELLVITNPATRSAADTYANARRAAGYRTVVRETGAGAGQIGTTATQIQTYIRGHVNSPICIRPSYVTIVGDDELVPTFTTGPGGIPSDNPYSTKNDSDELPDLAVGRILGNDLGQIDAALAKIIHYETSPPSGPMLNRALVAAQFQDTDDVGEVNDGQEDRTFVQFAETVRNGLVARGVAVDRVYEDNPTTDPQKFNDGTSLPASLKKPAFAWDGDGADVSAAWNQGRFMVVHRDHGWSDGWGDPFFTTTEVDALTNSNDNLPVVMSINCASAQYDTDETSFVQNALVKPTGGSVGVFGDTRNSPSWHNSQLGLGMVDALLPSVLSGEGPAAKQRVGDALVHGKLRLAALAPPSGPGIAGGDGNTRNELYLWHYFGDPTMQMWGGGSPPIVFNPNLFKAIYKELPPKPGDPPPFLVEISLPKGLAGQPISLLRNGEVIGKAFAGDGSAQVPATFNDGAPKPGELTVALEADGAAPVQFGVDGVPQTPTTLTQNCPTANQQTPFGSSATVTMTGKLTGAPAGSKVAVKFKHPDHPNTAGPPIIGPTETVEATTDADGNWSAQVTSTNRNDAVGIWQVSSSYAGTAQYAGSSADGCPVIVYDNS